MALGMKLCLILYSSEGENARVLRVIELELWPFGENSRLEGARLGEFWQKSVICIDKISYLCYNGGIGYRKSRFVPLYLFCKGEQIYARYYP